ncbi:hypothetical protein [Streptomyces anulatus]|nr:hypothetical protein [Streptomyces anulatus]
MDHTVLPYGCGVEERAGMRREDGKGMRRGWIEGEKRENSGEL